jgi:hypothetical protein
LGGIIGFDTPELFSPFLLYLIKTGKCKAIRSMSAAVTIGYIML